MRHASRHTLGLIWRQRVKQSSSLESFRKASESSTRHLGLACSCCGRLQSASKSSRTSRSGWRFHTGPNWTEARLPPPRAHISQSDGSRCASAVTAKGIACQSFSEVASATSSSLRNTFGTSIPRLRPIRKLTRGLPQSSHFTGRTLSGHGQEL